MQTQLTVAMIDACRERIEEHCAPTGNHPMSLRPEHLLHMCRRLEAHVDDWTEAKLNRWIGFLQCAMIANGIMDLAETKQFFERAKNAFGEPSADLVDHLDPDSTFHFELGGEG